MLSRKEQERRKARVLAALELAGDWPAAHRLAHAAELTYDTLKPPLESLYRAGLIERESAHRLARWGLAGASGSAPTTRRRNWNGCGRKPSGDPPDQARR
jgi:hypothetical protein